MAWRHDSELWSCDLTHVWSLVPWSNQSRAIKDDKEQGEKQMMRSSQVKDKGWNMSLSATWSLMTAGWHFQCNCCDSPLRTKKSLGTHMMIKHLKTLRQQRSLKWGTRTNMVAMRVDILKFCLLLENKLDACPKQENILWATKTALKKSAADFFQRQKFVIKLDQIAP